ncbi:hypothetical protein ABPG73_022321 [Tetrahymena malaccensis]
MIFIYFKLLIITFAHQCPNFTIQHMPHYLEQQIITNFLKIPNTNLLLINAQSQDSNKVQSSIVYYDDLSKDVDNIVNIIKGKSFFKIFFICIFCLYKVDYTILQMEFIAKTNQILIVSPNQLITANVYMLEMLNSLNLRSATALSLIQETDLAILTTQICKFYIVDVVQLKQVFSQDTCYYNYNLNNVLQFPKTFFLQNGLLLIALKDNYGFQMWSLDLTLNEINNHNYLPEPQRQQGSNTAYIDIDIALNQNILFAVGKGYQINIIQIVDLEVQKFDLLQSLNLMNAADDFLNVKFIKTGLFQFQKQSLFLSDSNNIYRLDFQITMNQSRQNTYSFTYQLANHPFPIQTEGKQFTFWYYLQENKKFIIPLQNNILGQSYTFIYSYADNTFTKRQFYTSTGWAKIFLINLNQINYYVTPQLNKVMVTLDQPFGNVVWQIQQDENIVQKVNSFIQIQNYPLGFIVLAGAHSMYQIKIFESEYKKVNFLIVNKLSQSFQQILYLSSLNLSISRISQVIVSFVDQNKYLWIMFGLPYKDNNETFLFWIIDLWNLNFKTLASDNSDDNLNKTCYALYSDQNKKIVGLDVFGNVYAWNSQDTSQFLFKKSISKIFNFNKSQINRFIQQMVAAYKCSNSPIGQLYNNQNIIYLIVVCDNNNVISFNIVTGYTQFLIQMSSSSNHVNSFEDIQLIGFGEKDTGNVYLFQFDQDRGQFNFFLLIQNVKYKDETINLTYLADSKTFYIQYQYSNYFFPIGSCLEDRQNCLNCDMNFYFNTTEIQQSDNLYGLGTVEQPFSSSKNLITSFLLLQQYVNLVYGVQQINANIYTSPVVSFQIFQELTNIDFGNFINLTIQSIDSQVQAKLTALNILEFKQFKMLKLKNIIIQYQLSSKDLVYQCGLKITDIVETATIQNINYQHQLTDQNNNCYSLLISNSSTVIQDTNIQSVDFSKYQDLILVSNSNQIIIQNFTLQNSIINSQFSILRQMSNVNMIINQIIIQNNTCNNQYLQTSNIFGQLFQAGQFNVSNMQIIGNQFCRQQIFTIIPNINQQNNTIQLQNITLISNKFYTTAPYLLLSAIYAFSPLPQHTLLVNNIYTSDNLYLANTQIRYQNSLNTTSLIMLDNIQSINIQNVISKNQNEIAFMIVSKIQNSYLYNISCYNDEQYFYNTVYNYYAGCLIHKEVNQFSLNLFNSSFINATDQQIISIQNQNYQNSQISLINVEIFNSYFYQTLSNSYSNPVFISTDYSSQIQILSSSFHDNVLYGYFYAETQSATGIQIINTLGSSLVRDTQFYNSKSYTNSNFMVAKSNSLIVQNCSFSNSSYDLQDTSCLLAQKGGCITAQSNIFQLSLSNFSQSTATIASFLYLESLNNKINIAISQSQFFQGISSMDGGAIYVDCKGSTIKFSISGSNFVNIYALSQKSNIQQNSIQKSSCLNMARLLRQAQFQSKISIKSFNLIEQKYIIDNDTTDPKGINQFFQNALGAVAFFKKQFMPQCHSLIQSYPNDQIFEWHFAIISIQNQNLGYFDTKHEFIFVGIRLINVLGNTDTNFLNVINADVKFFDIYSTNTEFQNIPSEIISMIDTQKFFTPTLIQAQNSNINFINATFFNITQSEKFAQPLLILSIDSTVILTKINISQSFFWESLIYATDTQLLISQSRFNKISNVTKSFPEIFMSIVKQQGNSLIQLYNSYLEISEQTFFNQIICKNNCFGSSLTLVNSKLNISDTYFTNSLAQNGGAIAILRGNQQNMIQNCNFNNNQALNGGAIYLTAVQYDNQYTKIINCKFKNNIAYHGYGGALYIEITGQNFISNLLFIVKTVIQSNQANIGGGIYNQGINPNLDSSIISNNQAYLYGDNQFSYPSQLYLVNYYNFSSQNNQKIIYGEFWGKSYTRSNQYQCQLCRELKYNSWKIVLTYIWILFSIFFTVKDHENFYLKKVFLNNVKRINQRIGTQSFLKPSDTPLRQYKNQKTLKSNLQNMSSKNYIKIFTNYAQIVNSAVAFNLNIKSCCQFSALKEQQNVQKHEQSLKQEMKFDNQSPYIIPNQNSISTLSIFKLSENQNQSQTICQYQKEQLIGMKIKSSNTKQNPKNKLKDKNLFDMNFNQEQSEFYPDEINANSLMYQNIFYQCGLKITNIVETAIIQNVNYQQQLTDQNSNCYSLYISNSSAIIQDTNISFVDFSKYQDLILVSNSNQIIIQNFTLQNSILNSQFSILRQMSNSNMTINQMVIQNNTCDNQYLSTSNIFGQLFQAGQFNVSNMHIIGNQFCRQQIFSIIPNNDQQNNTIQLQYIKLISNKFYTTAPYLLLSAIYPFSPFPLHALLVNNIYTSDNLYLAKSQIRYQNDLNTTSLLVIDNIKSINIQNVISKNQNEIAFLIAFKIQNSYLYNISCYNDKKYFYHTVSNYYAGCLFHKEVNQFSLNLFNSSFINATDQQIISIQNQNYQNNQISLTNVEIFNSYFYQTLSNSYSNPVFITSDYSSQIQILSSSFHDNVLYGYFYAETQSTTGIQIINSLGSSLIQDTQFYNSKSNSVYNFMFAQSNNLIVQNCSFSNSSYDLEDSSCLLIQYGGCIRAKSNIFQLSQSNFFQSTATIASFLYLESLNNQINIVISQSQFSQGISSMDGGAIYVNCKNSKLKFAISRSNFTDIYAFSQNSNIISIQNQNSGYIDSSHEFTFVGIRLTNVLGNTDTNFLYVINADVKFINIYGTNTEFQYIPSEISSMIDVDRFYTPTLIQAQNSNISFINSNFFNLTQSLHFTQPLLISSFVSTVIIAKMNISQSFFWDSLIYAVDTQVFISQSRFDNISTADRSRPQNYMSTVKYYGSALIQLNNSYLEMSEQIFFNQIICKKNCLGSSLLLVNSGFNISDAYFTNSQVLFQFIMKLFYYIIFQRPKMEELLQFKVEIIKILYKTVILIIILHLMEEQFIQQQVNMMQSYFLLRLNFTEFFKQSQNTTIINCKFKNNIAYPGYGGGLYIEVTGQGFFSNALFMRRTVIQSNQANIGGGIYNQGINPKLDSSIISHNQAYLYGDNQFSYPSQLYLINYYNFSSQNNQKIVINNFKSGNKIPQFIFLLKDSSYKPMKYIVQQQLTVKVQISSKTTNSSQYYFRGNTSVNMDPQQNIFVFNQIDLIGIPGSNSILEFVSDSIKVFNNYTQMYESNYTFEINVNFRNCVYGEIIYKYNNYTECQVCEDGKYSLDFQDCYPCPSGGDCHNGVVYLQSGYWRKEEHSIEIIQCYNQQQNCVGNSFGNNVCVQGNIGPLCEECDIYGEFWGKSYTRSNQYQCQLCRELKYNSWKIVLTYIWILFSIFFTVKDHENFFLKTVFVNNIRRQSQRFGMQSFQKPSNSLLQSQQNQKTLKSNLRNMPAKNYIKIFTNYAQIVSSAVAFNLNIESCYQFSALKDQQNVQRLEQSLKQEFKFDNQSPYIIHNQNSNSTLSIFKLSENQNQSQTICQYQKEQLIGMKIKSSNIKSNPKNKQKDKNLFDMNFNQEQSEFYPDEINANSIMDQSIPNVLPHKSIQTQQTNTQK